MAYLDYTHKFSSWIEVWVNWEIFEQSFWNRDITEDLLDLTHIAYQKVRKIIWIDWTWASWNSKIFDIKEFDKEYSLLEKWLDSVIITNLKETQEKISLILWVADCWAIAISDKSWNTIWLAHAWYAWVAKDIIWNTIENLCKINSNLEEFSFYVAPMIWKKFEFEEWKYFEIFEDLAKKYKLNLREYFNPILLPLSKIEKDSTPKWYLDLRKIIIRIFELNWICEKQIIFSEVETNNPNNSWPSYRLYTIYNSMKQKIEKWEKLTILEQELLDSENSDFFAKDKRIWVFVEN